MPGPVEFAIKTPNTDDAAHIKHALSLHLPEADHAKRTLHLVANGPSAGGIAMIPDIETMAVNGALQLFTEQGIAPTWWICCDPQGPGDNLTTPIDFLKDIPEETVYLVASKCHPAVFERLKHRDVRLWHVNDHPIPNVRQVPCAVSVTLCAMMLAMRLGYRSIHTWGWDCCYDGETHHAGKGDLSCTAERLKIEVGDEPDTVWFESNPTWCCEVEDALKILPVLKWSGVDVHIHGKSMIAAIAHGYAHA